MDALQKILNQTVKNKYIFGIALGVKKGSEEWHYACGDFKPDEQYFIASTTKLFTSSLIFKLRNAGKLQLEDSISNFLPEKILAQLHCLKGKDYSSQITIANLLAHTSGLPDYFQRKSAENKALQKELTEGKDYAWNFEQAIKWSKAMRPNFEPSKAGKAHYSDTNYQLLGKIIELQFEDSLKNIIATQICEPLNLQDTYLYSDSKDEKPKAIYYKSAKLQMPKAMSSFQADGSVVSTTKDMIRFLTAFMQGELYPKSYLAEIQQWNKIFFPLESGIGIHRFKVPWFFSPFKAIPELIGHSGLSGAFAFYVPKEDIYLTGTVNQIHSPGNSFKLMIQILSRLI